MVEHILIGLFGGGTADWNDIAQTKYDWKEIFENAKDLNGEEIDINDLYYSILDIARRELLDIIEEYVDNANIKEEIVLAEILDKITGEDFDLWANCLDTRIIFIGTIEQADIINKLFENEIEEINDKIGFTYIKIDGQ